MQTFRPVIQWWTLIAMRLLAHFSEVLEVHADRLVYRRGILSKNETIIPLARVTNFSTHQSFFARLFGVADYAIETAGSTGPELVLKGYSIQLKAVLASVTAKR